MSEVVLIPDTWGPAVEAAMGPIVQRRSRYTLAALQRDVKTGNVALKRVVERQTPTKRVTLGWVTLVQEGDQLVLQNGAAADGQRGRALRLAQPALERIARENGARSIRAHVATRARRRLLQARGYVPVQTTQGSDGPETILVKKVAA